MLFEKGVTSYLAKTISIPFSRDTIINTFCNNGLLNICALEDFFKGYYPTMVRLFLFALLGFPYSLNNLEQQLVTVKEKLLNYIQVQTTSNTKGTNQGKISNLSTNFAQTINFTEKINTIPIMPQPTNQLIEKYRLQRQPILSIKKGRIDEPSNNSLIKLMAAICELYSTCPTQVSPHQIIDYNGSMDNYFALLQQVKPDSSDTAKSSIVYNQKIFYSLCQLNIENCHLLFKDSLWKDYLKSFQARKEKFIAIMDMGVFINPSISYNAVQNIENKQLQQLVYDYIKATDAYTSLHSELIRQFNISDREILPIRLMLSQHELYSIVGNPFYTIEKPSI